MKKYKLWQVIKMMGENNELKFKNDRHVIGSSELGFLRLIETTYSKKQLEGNINLASEWELVQKPVTFNEVLKSVRRCRVEHEILNEYEITSLSDFMEFDFYMLNLCDCACLSSDEIKKIIKEGKWYLED